jgi:hypothetical protein
MRSDALCEQRFDEAVRRSPLKSRSRRHQAPEPPPSLGRNDFIEAQASVDTR